MAIYNREDSRTVLPQLEKEIEELKNSGVFIATIDKTTFKEVKDALLDGRIVFAITPNSYGTYNAYPYSYSGTTKIYFGRLHGLTSSPSYKLVTLADDNSWTTDTVNIVTS